MNIEVCIAQAINTELDLVQALPGMRDIPVEDLERKTHEFLDKTTDRILSVIENYGRGHVELGNARDLADLIRTSGIRLPRALLRNVCERIIELYRMNLDLEGWTKGHPVYSMRIDVSL